MQNELIEKVIRVIENPKFYIPVITIIFTIFFINSSSKLVKKLINKNSNSIEIKRRNTIVALLENIIKYIIIILAILIIINAWGINITGFVAGLGIAGVVVGLAIQDALKDIIMGVNIIMDNYFVVGDIVKYNDFTGEVIEFGLKSTKIKNADGIVLVIANREISSIYNLSQKHAMVSIIIPTSYSDTEEKIIPVIKSICKEIDSWKISIEKTEFLGVDNLNSSSVDYLIRAHSKPTDQWALKREILALIKREFDKNNLSIPYTQIEVHNGKRV